MFGKGDSYKRKTKIKRDQGSSGDEGGQIHERTKIKQKRRNLRSGGQMMGTGTTVMPGTVVSKRGRGIRHRSSSSSSSSSENRQRVMGTTNVPPVGLGTGMATTGYNQTYAPTTMTQPMMNPPVETLQQSSTMRQSKPGFVEKIKYKLRSKR